MRGLQVFAHICRNANLRACLIDRMWGYLQHYPGARRVEHSNTIIIQGIMLHVFVLPDFQLERFAGLNLKGFELDNYAEITNEQYRFLLSRVRG